MPICYPIRGRDKEVGLLLDAWREARDGNTRLVIVSGDPGTGKTRLVQELYHKLREVEDGGREYWPENFGYNKQTSHLSMRLNDYYQIPPNMPYFWFGLRCDSPIAGTPGSLEAFRNARGQLWHHFVQPIVLNLRKQKVPLAKFWGAGAAALKLAAVFFPDPTLAMLALGASVYTPALALTEHYENQRDKLKQQAVEQQAQQPDLKKLIKALMIEANQTSARQRGITRSPWIIAVDDVQWLDPDSRALLRELLSESVEHGHKLLVLATARSNMPEGSLPDIKKQLDKVRGDDRIYTDITLSDNKSDAHSLSADAARGILVDHLCLEEYDRTGTELIRRIEPPEGTVGRLLERAGRNPQYIIHYARHIRDLGLLDQATLELKATDEQLKGIPEAIEALIDERLKLLGEGSLKHTLMIGGSVQGEIFSAAYSEQLVRDSHTHAEVCDALDELVGTHHLLDDVEDISPPERLCKYRHTLTYERVRNILDSRKGFRERCQTELGNALRSKLEDNSLDNWPETERLSAWRTLCNLAHLRKQHGSEAEREAWERVEFRAGELALAAMHANGDNIEAEPLANRLWEAIKAGPEWIGDEQKIVTDMAMSLNNVFLIRSRYGDMLDCFSLLLDLFKQTNNERGTSQILSNMGIVYWLCGDYVQALNLYQQSLEVIQRIGDENSVAQILIYMGNMYCSCGDNDKALELYQQSLNINQHLGDEHSVALILSNMSVVYQSLRDFDKALKLCQKSYELLQSIGDEHCVAQILGNMGNVHWLCGDYYKALDLFHHSLEILQRLGDEHGAVKTLGNMGIVYRLCRDYDMALSLFQQSHEAFQRLGDKLGLANTHFNIAILEWDHGNLLYALVNAEEALILFEGVGDQPSIEDTRQLIQDLKAEMAGQSGAGVTIEPDDAAEPGGQEPS